MKKSIFMVIMLLLFLCGCSGGSVEETTEPPETAPTDAVEIGSSSYSCITGESGVRAEEGENGVTQVKAFSHRVYNPNNEYVVTLTSTVTGTCSEDSAKITHISGTLSDAEKDGFTVSEHMSGDTATVVLYLNQISVCHFQYRIHTDGTLEFL